MDVLAIAFKSDLGLEKFFERIPLDELPGVGPLTYPGENSLLQKSTNEPEGVSNLTRSYIEPNKSQDINKQHHNTLIEETPEESQTSEGRRTIIEKLFSPMEAGSIRGSIFNLIILSLGSGCLSLPKYVSKTSILMSSCLVIGIGLLVWRGLILISKACDKERIFVYSLLVRSLYGKGMEILYEINVILYSFGVLILYQVIREAIYNLFYFNIYDSNEHFLTQSFWSKWYIYYIFPYAVGLCIIFPLCLIKDVSKLRIFSMFGVITLLSLISLLIGESIPFMKYYWKNVYKEDNPSTHLNIYHVEKGFDTDLYFFQFSASLYYSYITTIGAVPIFNSLKNNVLRRIQKVVRRTVFFDIFLFLVISIIGYLTWPIKTPSLIIERDNIVKEADIPMSIGRIALVVTVIMKLPNNYNSLRITLFNTIWGTTEITTKKNVIVTSVVLIICCTVSVLYSEISGYIKLLGGLCSSIVGFIIPAMLYTRSNELPKYHWKNIFTLIFFVGLTLIGFVSAGRTVYEIITGK